jgi:hypothetical protein
LVTKRANVTCNTLRILSSEPKADALSFGSGSWKIWQRGKGAIMMVDMERLLRDKRRSAEEITSAITSPSRGERPRLTVGDWLHLVYGRFHVGLAVEEEEARRGVRNLICCFRSEGFWSLDVKHISRILELHDEVVFGNTVLRKRV